MKFSPALILLASASLAVAAPVPAAEADPATYRPLEFRVKDEKRDPRIYAEAGAVTVKDEKREPRIYAEAGAVTIKDEKREPRIYAEAGAVTVKDEKRATYRPFEFRVKDEK